MASVDLDDEFLTMFYSLTKSGVPANISLEELKGQLTKIVDTFKELNKSTKKPVFSKEEEDEEETLNKPAIMVVDDLGVITYQLKVLLSGYNMDVECSQEIYDAVSKFKKRKFPYVIMDLFIPTEREGFILLTELKKIAATSNQQTVVGIITASPRKEIEQQCKMRGADFFLEKSNDWQNQLKKIMDSYILSEDNDDF